MFEPVHGSAPPLRGKNVANPIGAILSAALMLETLGRREDAARIEAAVEAAVHATKSRVTSAEPWERGKSAKQSCGRLR
jgi:isocitrate/isopropylmalate dehydrogenase